MVDGGRFGTGRQKDFRGLYRVGRLRPGPIEEFVYKSRLGVVLALNLLYLAASLRLREVEEIDRGDW